MTATTQKYCCRRYYLFFVIFLMSCAQPARQDLPPTKPHNTVAQTVEFESTSSYTPTPTSVEQITNGNQPIEGTTIPSPTVAQTMTSTIITQTQQPIFVEHPEGRQTIDSTWVVKSLGCIADGIADEIFVHEVREFCDGQMQQLGCDSLVIPSVWWGEPESLFIECRAAPEWHFYYEYELIGQAYEQGEITEQEYEEQVEDWESTLQQRVDERERLFIEEGYLYNQGLSVFIPTRLILLQDGEKHLIKTLDDLQATVVPIDSLEKAMNYARAYTGLRALTLADLPQPDDYHPEHTINYFLSHIDESYGIENQDGYNVLLFDDSGDCKPWTTYAIWVQVNVDGMIQELSRKPILEVSPGWCID